MQLDLETNILLQNTFIFFLLVILKYTQTYNNILYITIYYIPILYYIEGIL